MKSSEYPLVAEPPAKLAEIKDMLSYFAAASVYKRYDLTNLKSFARVAYIVCGDKNAIPKELAVVMKKMCVDEGRPIFFHFDECGDLPVDDLRDLRSACWNVLENMNANELKTCFPFFYFSGRGTVYDELGSVGGTFGSHWLTLEPLERNHVATTLILKHFRFIMRCPKKN